MKLTLLIFSLFLSAFAFADVPHVVPTAGCPAGQICCPQALVCSFLEGCGDIGAYHMIAHPSKFEGLQTFNLSQIQANRQSMDRYSMNCIYSANYLSANIITLSDVRLFYLKGLWQYGFDKMSASCPTPDAAECSGSLVS